MPDLALLNSRVHKRYLHFEELLQGELKWIVH